MAVAIGLVNGDNSCRFRTGGRHLQALDEVVGQQLNPARSHRARQGAPTTAGTGPRAITIGVVGAKSTRWDHIDSKLILNRLHEALFSIGGRKGWLCCSVRKMAKVVASTMHLQKLF